MKPPQSSARFDLSGSCRCHSFHIAQGLACGSSSTTAARVNSKGVSVTGGCGLSLPVLKEGAIPRDAEGAIFHGARAKRIASHLRLCRIRRVYLGINEEQPEVIAGRHEFVFGDFENVHHCRLLSAESRAGQYNLASKIRSALTRNDRRSPTAIKAASASSGAQNRERAAT
jgi:hypothetical protein